ncbi:MAG TPA: ABC transporter permease [Vicinamibacterales bacterium]|nr:ABC transporter permease [Vicinamibacterales bacterium]
MQQPIQQTRKAIRHLDRWRFVEAVARDVRYAIRGHRQSPMFSLATIAVVALGIAASTAMLALVNAWLLRPLPLERPAELVSVWRTAAANPREPAFFDLYRDYLVWAAENRTLTALGATFEQDYALTGAGEPRQVQGALVSWNLFALVGARPAAGRLFQADDPQAEPSCVISFGLWRSQFGGSRDTVGRLVRLNDKAYRVRGVLSAGFSLRVLDRPFDPDVWTLIAAGDPAHTTASPTPVAVIGRLKPGVLAVQAQADLGAIQDGLNRRYPDEPSGSGVLVSGLQQDNTRTVRSSLLLLMGAVGVLLLIACVNAGSLVLGRHAQRRRDFAVRLALGCSVPRLLQQLTVEVLLLFACGGAVGVGLAAALVRLFVVSNPLGVLPPGGISIDGRVLAMIAVVVGGVGLLFGSVPALRSLRGIGDEALHARAATAGRGDVRSRMWFVALELALSVVLLVTAGLLISSFAKISAVPLGFDTQNVFVTSVGLPWSRYPTVDEQTRFGNRLVARLRTQPSVRAAAVAASWPFQANGLNPIDVEGRPLQPEQAPHAFIFTVGPSYFDALGIPMLKGREFIEADGVRTPGVAVINEAMARRAFPGADPLGRSVRIRYPGKAEPTEPWLTVVGVASNTRSQRYNHLEWDQEPAVYTALYQRRASDAGTRRFETQTLYIYLRAQSMTAAPITAAVHAVDADLPVGSLRTSGAIVSELRAQPRLRAQVLGGFAVLTLTLALVGVYGVMAQFVELRRHEIGIRVALGAGQSQVVRIVLRRTLALAAAGLAAGAVTSVAVSRLLEGMLFGVSARDPLTLTVVVTILAVVSLVASYVPARVAAAIDPNVILRCE